MYKQKYIIIKHGDIIIFPGSINHSDFREFSPISAGFISFGVNQKGNPTCECYGESVSLGLKSDPEKDTIIARRQLNMMEY